MELSLQTHEKFQLKYLEIKNYLLKIVLRKWMDEWMDVWRETLFDFLKKRATAIQKQVVTLLICFTSGHLMETLKISVLI